MISWQGSGSGVWGTFGVAVDVSCRQTSSLAVSWCVITRCAALNASRSAFLLPTCVCGLLAGLGSLDCSPRKFSFEKAQNDVVGRQIPSGPFELRLCSERVRRTLQVQTPKIFLWEHDRPLYFPDMVGGRRVRVSNRRSDKELDRR